MDVLDSRTFQNECFSQRRIPQTARVQFSPLAKRKSNRSIRLAKCQTGYPCIPTNLSSAQFHQPRLLQLHLYPHIRIQIDIRLDTPEHRRPVRVHVLPEAHPMQRASNWNIVLILGSRRTEVETGFNAT